MLKKFYTCHFIIIMFIINWLHYKLKLFGNGVYMQSCLLLGFEASHAA